MVWQRNAANVDQQLVVLIMFNAFPQVRLSEVQALWAVVYPENKVEIAET
jgi:hypothetical protein